jgi:hypothetical protein
MPRPIRLGAEGSPFGYIVDHTRRIAFWYSRMTGLMMGNFCIGVQVCNQQSYFGLSLVQKFGVNNSIHWLFLEVKIHIWRIASEPARTAIRRWARRPPIPGFEASPTVCLYVPYRCLYWRSERTRSALTIFNNESLVLLYGVKNHH